MWLPSVEGAPSPPPPPHTPLFLIVAWFLSEPVFGPVQYGSIKVAGNDSTAFILDFFNDLQRDGITVKSNWLPASDDVCCNNATDSSCAGKYDEWKRMKDANLVLPHMLLLGDPTDTNACEENDNCINLCFRGEGSISADSLRGDVASPLVLGIFGSIGMYSNSGLRFGFDPISRAFPGATRPAPHTSLARSFP